MDFAIGSLLHHRTGEETARRTQPAGLRPESILRHTASMTGSNCLIRRDVFFAVGGFDAAMTVFNDWDLPVRLVDAGFRYTVAPAAVAEWRDHAGPRIATFDHRRADGIERFLRRYRTRLSATLRRDLETTMLGIRRRRARSRPRRLLLTLRLAMAHGWTAAGRRGGRSAAAALGHLVAAGNRRTGIAA